ncbi:phage tail tape measure protein [filamentous cyanobacterium CCP4]|nr:phage tail tape measure protein [filamentous cyanobacterium CCP4]
MALQVASLYGVLNLQDNMTPALNTALGNARSFGSTITNIGNNVTTFGRNVTAATAPLGAGLLASVNQSNQFSRSMSNINSILGITGEEAAALRAQLLAYGGDTVAGPQAVASAYYDIVSGVADASTHMAILDAATRTSEAGQADLTATTSALISTMNSYRLGADDATYVSDIFTRTVQTGVLTMDELASAFPQVTGLASSMGLEIDDLAGQLSFMTTQGFSASQSATFLRGMMTTLLNPTTNLSNAFTAMGYESGQAMIDALGLVGAYEAIREFGGGAFDGLITNQEALQGAIALTGEGANEFLTNFSSDITGATEAARGIQNETAGWSIFTSQLQRLAITTGDTLAPVLLDLLNNHITPLIERVSAWITENPQLASTIAMVTGAAVILGPVLMFIGGTISAIGGIVSAVTVGFGLLGGAIALAASPIGVLLIAGAALIWMFTREGGIIGSLNEAWTAFKQLSYIIFHATGVVEAWNQAWAIASAVVSGEVNANQVVQSVNNQLTGQTQRVGGGGQPGRYAGGPVTARRSYIVGERGPELFTPSSSGTISSNADTRAAMNSGGDSFNFYGDIIANDPETFMSELEQRRRRRN